MKHIFCYGHIIELCFALSYAIVYVLSYYVFMVLKAFSNFEKYYSILFIMKMLQPINATVL